MSAPPGRDNFRPGHSGARRSLTLTAESLLQLSYHCINEIRQWTLVISNVYVLEACIFVVAGWYVHIMEASAMNFDLAALYRMFLAVLLSLYTHVGH